MFKKYINYLRDNPNSYWFKAKLYGWGWTPAKWQGWVVLLVWLAFFVYFTNKFNARPVIGVFSVLLLTAVLIGICYKKGEKPGWRWGLPKDEKGSDDLLK